MVPGRRRIRSNTASASRRCGTAFGCAKLDTSMTGRSRPESKSTIRTLVSVSIQRAKLCKPSRGPTSATIIVVGSESAIVLQSVKRRELVHFSPLGLELVDRRVGIGMAERHAANDDLMVGNAEQRPDDRMKIGEGGLRASIEPVPPRRDHDRPDHDTEIEPAS